MGSIFCSSASDANYGLCGRDSAVEHIWWRARSEHCCKHNGLPSLDPLRGGDRPARRRHPVGAERRVVVTCRYMSLETLGGISHDGQTEPAVITAG